MKNPQQLVGAPIVESLAGGEGGAEMMKPVEYWVGKAIEQSPLLMKDDWVWDGEDEVCIKSLDDWAFKELVTELVAEIQQDALAARDEEIARLKEALEDIASGKYSGVILTSFPPQDAAVNRARAALNGEKPPTP